MTVPRTSHLSVAIAVVLQLTALSLFQVEIKRNWKKASPVRLSLVFVDAAVPVDGQGRRRSIGTRFFPATKPKGSTTGRVGEDDSFSMDSLTCLFYEQPLNHFDLPRNRSGTFHQRYCISNQFVREVDKSTSTNTASKTTSTKAPIFFYTGNESPLEVYVEHTGLLWEMAREFGAQVVFAEHRYEGESIPTPSTMPSCLAYSSSVQAIADYARLIRNVLWRSPVLSDKNTDTDDNKPIVPRPVICFGGSYGGMLSAWIRMRYPQWVAGAIAASAPIWGFPLSSITAERNYDTLRMDDATAVIRHGLSQPYPPNGTTASNSASHEDEQEEEENHCPNNLLLSFPLVHVLGQNEIGLDYLEHTFRLCPGTLTSSDVLLGWLQTPWFDLAEASFPYPSSYIPNALNHLNITLPAWPLQAACWKTGLAKDYGIVVQGSLTNVTYNISVPLTSPPHLQPRGSMNKKQDPSSSYYSIQVDWDQAISSIPIADWITIPTVTSFLSSIRNAVSIWYNMTHNVSCYDVSQAAPNTYYDSKDASSYTVPQTKKNNQERALRAHMASAHSNEENLRQTSAPTANKPDTCQERMHMGSWPSLCCNEDLNLIMTLAQGVGRDCFWPPSVPRNVKTYPDFVEFFGEDLKDPVCEDPDGSFGFPAQPDPWSNWLDFQYASYRVLESSSNILFSNGLLDPWSAAGVVLNTTTTTYRIQPGLTWQKHKNGLASLLLEYGGHHVDLMFSDDQYDPPSFRAAREIERFYVSSWIQEFWNTTAGTITNDGCNSIEEFHFYEARSRQER